MATTSAMTRLRSICGRRSKSFLVTVTVTLCCGRYVSQGEFANARRPDVQTCEPSVQDCSEGAHGALEDQEPISERRRCKSCGVSVVDTELTGAALRCPTAILRSHATELLHDPLRRLTRPRCPPSADRRSRGWRTD